MEAECDAWLQPRIEMMRELKKEYPNRSDIFRIRQAIRRGINNGGKPCRRGVRVTEELMRKIWNEIKEKPEVSLRQFALRHGLPPKVIEPMVNGQTWNQVTGLEPGQKYERKKRHGRLQAHEAQAIIDDLHNTMLSVTEIAKKHNVSRRTMAGITTGRQWASLRGVSKLTPVKRPKGYYDTKNRHSENGS